VGTRLGSEEREWGSACGRNGVDTESRGSDVRGTCRKKAEPSGLRGQRDPRRTERAVGTAPGRGHRVQKFAERLLAQRRGLLPAFRCATAHISRPYSAGLEQSGLCARAKSFASSGESALWSEALDQGFSLCCN